MKIKSCYEFEFQMILRFARILKKKKKKNETHKFPSTKSAQLILRLARYRIVE